MPQKGALLFLFLFSMLGREICGNRHFWTCFGTNGKQRNSAEEESSNGASQDEVSSHLAGKPLTTASHITTRRRRKFNQRVQFQVSHKTASQDTTRRRLNFTSKAQHQTAHMTPSHASTRRRRGPWRNPRFWKLLLSDGVAAYKATPSRPVLL